MRAFEIIGDSADREAWLALRRSGIGASDMAGVLGVSPFASPLSVYASKVADTEDEESEVSKWGRILEPHIIDEFAKDLSRAVTPQGRLLRSTRWPWMLATLDAEQQCAEKPGPGILEVKATGFRVGDWTDGIPDHVRVQAQQQLAVTGYEWGSVAVLLNGMKLLYADIERDETLIERIAEAGTEFWERVEKREPPNPDGSAASREALRALYPRDTGETIALPAGFLDLDDEQCLFDEAIKESESKKAAIENQIKAAIGDATFGELPNGVLYSWKWQERKGYTVKPTEFRVLRRSDKWRRE